jgi:5-methylthioadenosine/S-adenosylhomocysteine deaminase
MEGAPVAGGAILIGSDGRITAVGLQDAVPRPPGVPSEHFPGAALLPGFVNAHTHLELTGLAGAIDEPDFADWIREIIALKATFDYAHFLRAAREGLRDCFAAGVTTVADTGDSGAVIEALWEEGASGIAYQEVFGPHPDQCAESLARLKARVEERRRFTSDRVRIGVSPHAPYTVSGPLYRAVGSWAAREGLPVATHLSESLGELALFRDGTGTFAEMWASRGIPLPGRPTTPIEWLERHDALGPSVLCAHLVQATPSDIEILARTGAAGAHCPLSNRAHAHGVAPVGALLAAGIRLGCGTDSVVSVGRLDLLAAAREASELADLDAEAALELCTTSAARAIGLGHEIGSLEAGKRGDVAVIAIGKVASPGAALERALASGTGDVVATILSGREVYRRNR